MTTETDITINEILEVSQKIEREGAAYYSELAKHIPDPKIKELVNTLAHEESQHEKQFKKLLIDKPGAPMGWETQESVREVIKTEFQTDIFPKLDEVMANVPEFDGIQKAFNFAIEAEKISIEFYSLLGEFCTQIEVKTFLTKLEKAEREHLVFIKHLQKQFTESCD